MVLLLFEEVVVEEFVVELALELEEAPLGTVEPGVWWAVGERKFCILRRFKSEVKKTLIKSF